jgi:hypothetical protein
VRRSASAEGEVETYVRQRTDGKYSVHLRSVAFPGSYGSLMAPGIGESVTGRSKSDQARAIEKP